MSIEKNSPSEMLIIFGVFSFPPIKKRDDNFYAILKDESGTIVHSGYLITFEGINYSHKRVKTLTNVEPYPGVFQVIEK